jgi:hypothetical protein
LIKTEIVAPNIKNFIKSFRDVGYTFEIAVADVLDNSISANATEIKIQALAEPEPIFSILDNGNGMSESELLEAMRLATNDPDEQRKGNDLGRFGLGLKTASFSQCKTLTVISKKNNAVSIKQWDLDYLEQKNKWYLITPEIKEYNHMPFVKELIAMDHGTVVIWQKLDRYKKEDFSIQIYKLRKHLSLVFHRFLEAKFNTLKIIVNENPIKPFNPFNANHPATIEKAVEKIKIYNSEINITPFILPHHKKLSQEDWESYSTEEGYIKSQGFYLYRANRLLIHGTWWGLHKAVDAHKLVRIKIDIDNDQDRLWGIDIKKSTASPMPEIRKDLKRVISEVTKEGVKPFTGRGRKIKDKTVTRFWQIISDDKTFHYGLNKEHPIYKKLLKDLPNEISDLFKSYVKGLEVYLPLDSIQSSLQQTPYKLNQENILQESEVSALIDQLKNSGIDNNYIDELLKAEMFENHKKELKK